MSAQKEKLHSQTALIRIGGMTCVNCQNLIEQTLSALPGVQEASASFRNGEVRIRFDAEVVSLRRIEKEIVRLGYTVVREENSANIMRTSALLVLIVSLYAVIERLELLNALVPARLADSSMGYGMLFIVGLLTSVHCVAMCGGINLSQSLASVSSSIRNSTEKKRKTHATFPAFLYNAGRVISYTAAGFLLGLAGMLLGGAGGTGIPLLLQGTLKIAAGIFMVITGLSMLELFPTLRRIFPVLPKIGVKKTGRRPFSVGLLNGFMPCGPLQSMQILALASGSPISGALSMLMFSLGTVPLMAGLGALVSMLGKKFTHAITGTGAVLVAVLGLAMLSQGGSLSGMLPPARLLWIVVALSAAGIVSCVPARKNTRMALAAFCVAAVIAFSFSLPNIAGRSQTEKGLSVQIKNGVQLVKSDLLPGRYPTITVKSGIPVRWTIQATAQSINGCNYKMIIGEYGITHSFKEGENIIEFTPNKPGSVLYTCWMGMIRGTIIVS